MDTSKRKYISPFSTRYASDEMQYIFSEEYKFKTWRKLWIALAKAEKELGLDITDEQIAELEKYKDDINFEVAQEREKQVRHDVMSHVYAYGRQCPKAEPIIHLGATSCYVGDNTDVIIMREASELVIKKAVQVLKNLSEFAMKYKGMPCLAYTHLQPAQLTTVGKRATLWMYELEQDIKEMQHRLDELLLLGSKGTTGTQASFIELFEGDEEKVKALEEKIAKSMNFKGSVAVSGQTYSRKTDAYFLAVLSGFAQSAYKFSNDLRLLQSFEEMEEPFEKNQIGSSAMPYKRNPMRSERIASLARFVIADLQNPAFTAASQWFERTLDDSANRRISVPEAFLAVDGILSLYINVVDNGVVYPKMAEKHLREELPFMATENILMYCVEKGGDRQALHEEIRKLSVETAKNIKLNGGDNDILEKIAADKAFGITKEELNKVLDGFSFTGIAEEQTEDFIQKFVTPVLEKNASLLGVDVKISV